MCGICGIYNFDHGKTVDRQSLYTMTKCLHHRGPDGAAVKVFDNVGLGHTRLSIIDLSDAATQPMTDEEGRFWIVFNGAIYNYLELRQELLSLGHRFRSVSDTEVLLHLYAEKGEDCVHELNGMFAFAIWDSRERSLFAARDRLGIKPFYYVLQSSCFLFSSEIKALFKSSLLEPQLDRSSLADYLNFQFCLGEKTLFKGVQKLMPGNYLTLKADGQLRTCCYWDLDFTIESGQEEDYFQNQLQMFLEDSVRLQLRADVPIGSQLSGGLDSSVVSTLASSMTKSSFQTFSGAFREDGFNETQFAQLAADNAATIHQEIFPSPDEFVELMPKLAYVMDEPAGGPGLFPQYLVSKLASKSVKVVLTGHGGDEIFGGYIRYLIAYLESCLKGGIEGTQGKADYVVTFESILPNLSQLKGYGLLLGHFWKDGLFEPVEQRYFRLINRGEQATQFIHSDYWADKSYSSYEQYRDLFCKTNCPSLINRMTNFDIKTLLPALLHVEDRTSMAFSLESRIPLLDHRIVELAASAPPIVKFKGGRCKYMFRETVKNLIPKKIFDRNDKMGFPVPLSSWYRQDPVKGFVREVLLGSKSRSRGFLRTDSLESLLNGELQYDRGIWGLLNLELWMRAYLDGESDFS